MIFDIFNRYALGYHKGRMAEREEQKKIKDLSEWQKSVILKNGNYTLCPKCFGFGHIKKEECKEIEK